MTICPRRCDFEVSACHVGTLQAHQSFTSTLTLRPRTHVEVFMPFPNPVIHLPTIICGSPKELACNVAPTIIIELPTKIVLFLPSVLPNQIVATAPKKQPRVYPPTVMPWMFEAWLAVLPGGGLTVSISGKWWRKEGRVRSPPITPWSGCC